MDIRIDIDGTTMVRGNVGIKYDILKRHISARHVDCTSIASARLGTTAVAIVERDIFDCDIGGCTNEKINKILIVHLSLPNESTGLRIDET